MNHTHKLAEDWFGSEYIKFFLVNERMILLYQDGTWIEMDDFLKDQWMHFFST